MHNNIKISGSSHSEFISLIFNGNIKGYKIDYNFINTKVKARKSSFYFNTSRVEKDEYELNGVKDNCVLDNYLEIKVKNNNIKSKDYLKGIVRPSHGDIVGYQVLGHDFEYAGGGVHSGRLTVLYVILGAIIEFNTKDIKINGQIKQIHNLIDDDIRYINDLSILDTSFPVINSNIKEKMIEKIKLVHEENDSIGAKLTFRIDNLNVGIGGFFFDSFESILSKYLFGIGGIKAVEFGLGYDYLNLVGSSANDSYYVEDKKIKSKFNNQGGLNSGFTNGIEPVIFSVVVRPTPTILKDQATVKLNDNNEFENVIYKAQGRHDTFFANRVIQVVKACVFISLLDMETYE